MRTSGGRGVDVELGWVGLGWRCVKDLGSFATGDGRREEMQGLWGPSNPTRPELHTLMRRLGLADPGLRETRRDRRATHLPTVSLLPIYMYMRGRKTRIALKLQPHQSTLHATHRQSGQVKAFCRLGASNSTGRYSAQRIGVDTRSIGAGR